MEILCALCSLFLEASPAGASPIKSIRQTNPAGKGKHGVGGWGGGRLQSHNRSFTNSAERSSMSRPGGLGKDLGGEEVISL